VEADFAVELGADDETLELPWAAETGGPVYFDLKRNPELLSNIEEANKFPDLGEFLLEVNSADGIFETAKCDAWVDPDFGPEDEIFDAACKFGCYVDLLFSQPSSRFSFSAHEKVVKELTQLLRRAPEIPCRTELLVRRCYFHASKQDGFYITLYLFGYGGNEEQARTSWRSGLRSVSRVMESLKR
jgi:hypothetical protein